MMGARIFYTLPGERIRLRAFPNNIFKEDGVLRRGPLAFFGNTSSIYARRRTVGISVDATF